MNRLKPLAELFRPSEIVFGEYTHRRGLSRVLGLSEVTLWRMERDGDGPKLTKVRRLRLYKISAVESWLAKLDRKPRTPIRPARSAAHA